MVSRTKSIVLVGSVVLLLLLVAGSFALVSAAPVARDAEGARAAPHEDAFIILFNLGVSISKSDTPDPVYAGQELFYEITVNNSTVNQVASNVLVTDTLPGSVTYIADTAGCDTSNLPVLSCSLPDIAPAASRSFQVKVAIPSDLVAGESDGTVAILNTVEVTGTGALGEEDVFLDDNYAEEGTFVEDLADLTVVKMSKPDINVEAGELFTYTIYVENLGPSYARNVSIRDEILSSGAFTLVDVLDDPNRDSDACWVAPYGGIPEGPGETIECDLREPLEPKDIFGQGRWIIQVAVQANQAQDVNNLVQVFTRGNGTRDPDLSNNTAEDFIYVTAVADLSIDKYLDDCWYDGMDGDGGCVAGGYAEFRLNVRNDGPSTAQNVVVEDLLPSGVTVVGVDGDGACTTGIPGDPFAPLTCNLGSIPSGEGRSINVVAQIDPDYVDAELPFDYRQLENDAWVSSETFDPDNSNNRDFAMVDVYTLSQLAITKWGFPAVAVPGQEAEYEIRIRNAGPSTVDMLHFVDLLPQAVIYQDYWIEQGTGTCTYHDSLPWPWWQDYRGVHCYVDEIAPEGVAMVHLRVQYSPDVNLYDDYFPAVCNVIPDDDPTSGWPDLYGVDDPFRMPGWFADSYITIPFENSPLYFDDEYFGWCPEGVFFDADLSIQKSVEPLKVYPGYEQLYHVQVTNNGPMDAPDVIVTDTLPSAVDYEIDNDNCDLFSEDPDVLECHLGTIPAGQTVGFDISALVDADAPPGEITNTAVVSMPYDPNQDNNTASATNLVLEPILADLELQKTILTPPGPPFYAGRDIRFRLQVTNHGPVAAENVALEDMLPEGVSVFLVNPGPGSCTTGTPGSEPLRCNLGTLAVDASATVIVSLHIDPDYVGDLENDAVVSSDIPDLNNSNNRDYVIVNVSTRSDVFLKKGCGWEEEVLAGEQIQYDILVRNDGPSTVHNFELWDLLPDDVTFLSYQMLPSSGGECFYTPQLPPMHGGPGQGLHCYLGDVAPDATRILYVRVRIDPDAPQGSLTNAVTDWAAESNVSLEGSPANLYCDNYVINEADLSIRKTANPWKVFAGEQVMYTIEVTNRGPGNAYGVLVTDTLPSAVGFELSTDPDCYPVDGQVVCEWNMLGLGQTRSFQIFGRVDPEAAPGTVSNRVDVDSDADDPIGYNDYASAPILIQGRADLRIQKFGKPEGEVRAGDELTYTVIVDNLGTGYAHNVTLDDVLESDGSFDLLEVTSSRDALCDPLSGTFENEMFLSCALSDTLEVKGPTPGSGRWMITVVVQANEPQDINNVAHVAGSDYDPDLSNNEAMAEHEITAVADLELTKEARGEMPVGCEGETELWLNEVAAGGMVTYTLTVSNTGPSTAENVVVLDEPLPLPDLLEINVQSITPSQGNCQTGHIVDQGRLSCNLSTILPGESANVTFVAHVPSSVADYTVLVNDAQAYSDMFDDNNGNDMVSNHTVVSRVADLEVEKTQDPEISLPGWDITYTITVTNLGLSDAEGVFISDTIPVQVLDPTWTCCASDGGLCDIPCEPPVCPQEPCPWPEIGLFAQADIPAGEWVIYTVEGTLDWWPCGPFTNTVELIPPQSLVHPDVDIDPCDENNVAEAVNDPFCHFDPLVLKAYPGSDSPP